MASPQTPPPPPGYSNVVANPNYKPAQPPPAPPPGYSSVVANPNHQPDNSPTPADTDNSPSWYNPTEILKGVAKGAQSTLAGIDELAHKAGEAIHPGFGDWLTTPLVGEHAAHTPTGLTEMIEGKGKSTREASAEYRNLEHQRAQTHNTAQSIGYGGETLAEFLLGDEALKGLSMSDKLGVVGKAMKVLEKSPRLIKALRTGADIEKVGAEAGLGPEAIEFVRTNPLLAKMLHIGAGALRAGATQAAQTYTRTGGDAEAAAKEGLTTAATAGALGTATAGAGSLVRKAGKFVSKGANSAANLAETAANAPDKQTIVQNIKGQLVNAVQALHSRYEVGVQDLQSRLGGTSVEAADSPMAAKAQELLKNPVPEDHPWTAQAKEVAGQKLDKSTRDLLQNVADGVMPVTEEEEAAAKEASAPSGLVDAKGNPIASEPVEATGKAVAPLTVRDLIQQRQAIRAAADSYEQGDVNARALRGLLYGIDDTIDQIATKAGDADALSDYQALRGDYKEKIAAFRNPVIKSLIEGKPDDAAKAFIATKNASGLPAAGRTAFNAAQLKTVLGDKGFNEFRTQVFDGLLKSASDEQGFNPAKFMSLWKRVADGTKSDVFGVNPETTDILPQNYINQLSSDAKTAANLQKLMRYGVVGTAGTVGTAATAAAEGMFGPKGGAGAIGGLTTILSLILGHPGEAGSGVAKGRELIDYVANHPKMWATLRKVSAKASNVSISGDAASRTAAGLLNTMSSPGQSDNDEDNTGYDAARGALGGNNSQAPVYPTLDTRNPVSHGEVPKQ